VWSKDGSFVEGLHRLSDFLTKVSGNCVLIYMLHYYLCVYFYGYCLFMMHVYVYCYFRMTMCIYRMIFYVLIYIYSFLQDFLCVYVLICIQFNFFYVA
jgi:hypothetical protein